MKLLKRGDVFRFRVAAILTACIGFSWHSISSFHVSVRLIQSRQSSKQEIFSIAPTSSHIALERDTLIQGSEAQSLVRIESSATPPTPLSFAPPAQRISHSEEMLGKQYSNLQSVRITMRRRSGLNASTEKFAFTNASSPDHSTRTQPIASVPPPPPPPPVHKIFTSHLKITRHNYTKKELSSKSILDEAATLALIPWKSSLRSELAAQNTWVPVTHADLRETRALEPECRNRTNCSHCCLGQCHQVRFHHQKPRNLLYKYIGKGGREMSTIRELIRETKLHLFGSSLDPDQDGYASKVGDSDTCNIFFLGDSLSHDTAVAAICQTLLLKDELGRYLYEISSCNPSAWGENSMNPFCDSTRHPQKYNHLGYIEFERTNNDPSLCQRVMFIKIGLWDPYKVQPSPGVSLVFDELSTLSTNKGLMIWNWGVWCNNPGELCIANVMNQTLLPAVQDPRFSDWHQMWRETEPQHFNTPDGSFSPLIPNHCIPSWHPETWRNAEAKQFLQNNNLQTTVSWIPIAEPLTSRWQFHYPTDCTHYCYTPWRLHITWDGIVQALRDDRASR